MKSKTNLVCLCGSISGHWPLFIASSWWNLFMRMKDKFYKQSSAEEFWGAHIKRHNSASNISNQLFNECVNQNIVFLTQKFGQFSSLENLSSKLYKEHKDDRFYVRNPQSSTWAKETDHFQHSDKQTDEPSYDRIYKSHDKIFANETKKRKVRKSSSINPKNKSNTINKLMKSFSLKRPKESKNVVNKERFQTLSSDFTEHLGGRSVGAEEHHKLSLLRESLVTGHPCQHLAELDLWVSPRNFMISPLPLLVITECWPWPWLWTCYSHPWPPGHWNKGLRCEKWHVMTTRKHLETLTRSWSCTNNFHWSL